MNIQQCTVLILKIHQSSSFCSSFESPAYRPPKLLGKGSDMRVGAESQASH